MIFNFINCVAWKQTATFIQQYFKKGSRIGIEGNIQTRSYEDKDQVKHFITEVIVDAAEFVESQAAPKAQEEPEKVMPQALPFEI